MREQARQYYDNKIKKFEDADKRIFNRVIPKDASKIKKIHLSGVCGTAVGSLAVLLSEKGFELSGSDTNIYPPMSDVIERLGIKFCKGYSADNIKDVDLVIIGNVCGTDNPEAVYAKENNIPTISLPEAIHCFFIDQKKSLVVAGTHGKTTTTGILAHLFKSAGKQPGYMIGGVMQAGEESSVVGEGDYFIIEGDEYDTAYFDKSPKFLHYTPSSAIITSLEFDHVDIYKDMEEYTQAFEFFIHEIPKSGALFVCGDYENLKELSNNAECEVVTYGFGAENQVNVQEEIVTEEGQEFCLWIRGEKIGKFFIPLPGKHNLLNSMAVCALALREGLTVEQIQKGMKSFKGMKRRQEVVAEVRGITIIDDFAHHPTAVKETISAIKDKYPGRRLFAFFEPRSNTSRRKIFETEYGNSFNDADLVYISTPAHKSNDSDDQFINPDVIVRKICETEGEAYSVRNAEELLDKALPSLKSGDVILIMSNGSFDGIHQKLAQRLAK